MLLVGWLARHQSEYKTVIFVSVLYQTKTTTAVKERLSNIKVAIVVPCIMNVIWNSNLIDRGTGPEMDRVFTKDRGSFGTVEIFYCRLDLIQLSKNTKPDFSFMSNMRLSSGFSTILCFPSDDYLPSFSAVLLLHI